jgi:hypothetical protein
MSTEAMFLPIFPLSFGSRSLGARMRLVKIRRDSVTAKAKTPSGTVNRRKCDEQNCSGFNRRYDITSNSVRTNGRDEVKTRRFNANAKTILLWVCIDRPGREIQGTIVKGR